MRALRWLIVVVVSVLIGIGLGAWLFTSTQRRPVIDTRDCRNACLDMKELGGLAASVGIQKSPWLPTDVILETDRTIVLRHPRPRSDVHYVIVPKRDIRDVADLTAEDAAHLQDAFAALGTIVRRERLERYQLFTNGPGYQLVTYLHFHLQADTGGAAKPAAAVHQPSELGTAARDIVGFLRGQRPFSTVRLADTVTLIVAPEGGGDRIVVARENLRDPSNWRIRAANGATYSFVPPAGLARLTTAPGRHLNCREHDLSTRFPELAVQPHVGTMLARDSAATCLQTWNATFVFDSAAKPPMLIAVVYDQWEW